MLLISAYSKQANLFCKTRQHTVKFYACMWRCFIYTATSTAIMVAIMVAINYVAIMVAINYM